MSLEVVGARSLKDRRKVVKSFKDRARSKLPISVAEVGDVDRYQLATLGVVTVCGDAKRCQEVMSRASQMANTLAGAVLTDVRSEVVPFGFGGQSVRGGVEQSLMNPSEFASDFQSLADDPDFVPLRRDKKYRS